LLHLKKSWRSTVSTVVREIAPGLKGRGRHG
jgi:hypothetical protein